VALIDESNADDGVIQEFNQLSVEKVKALKELAGDADPGWNGVPPAA
jgi:hypothetical protein